MLALCPLANWVYACGQPLCVVVHVRWTVSCGLVDVRCTRCAFLHCIYRTFLSSVLFYVSCVLWNKKDQKPLLSSCL